MIEDHASLVKGVVSQNTYTPQLL